MAVALVGEPVSGEEGPLLFDPGTGQYLSLEPEIAESLGRNPLAGLASGESPLVQSNTIQEELWSFEEDPCDPNNPAWWGPKWIRGFSVFGGVHGFKGPSDFGRNGNFGFHEGINYGAPLLERLGFGCQIGCQVTHSNFKGDQLFTGSSDARHQVFLTAGVFHRIETFGIQSAVVFDYFHDEYYDRADLKQIRSETAIRLGPWRELGYWGAYNVGGDRVRLTDWITLGLKPEDLFALFYRRHFTGGGQGRVWTGLSGHGDVFLGAEATVPMGTNWALENTFTYLMPEEGGSTEEIWAVAIRLVWYPGRPSRCVLRDLYQPMLNVADNSVFMVRRD